MTKATKVLHTIPSLLILATILFPRSMPLFEFEHAGHPLLSYYIHMGVIFMLVVLQIVILVKKIKTFKTVEKSIKSKWIGILLMYNTLGALVFVWTKVDELELLNRENEPTES